MENHCLYSLVYYLRIIFYENQKQNLVTLGKCNLHLQYYKIDLSLSIKSQEINLNACEEHKIARAARSPNGSELP